ncbi:MAG: PD-(D/E)XK nuclease family protein [Bdellovibrio sp.]|nr:PD-(D/E)XK nuclease family protein [Bdellovibrio sp.]
MALDSLCNALHILPLAKFFGLKPEAWLCVGAGYAREELKALLFSQGRGFVGRAVLTLPDLACLILGVPSEKILSASARQEVLRKLFADSRIEKHFSELRRLKRRKDFLAKLDLALQTGRMTFAHPEEGEVYRERLFQSSGVENPVRLEVRTFASAYEAWMRSAGYYDLPLLLTDALQKMDDPDFAFEWPKEIWHITLQKPESLESAFWERVGHWARVNRVGTPQDGVRPESGFEAQPELSWKTAHTLDDAAEFFVDDIQKSLDEGVGFQDMAVLIPDEPSLRRTLKRALEYRGIPLAEPRDPTQLLWEESMKWVLKPLEVVARGFSRDDVISWIRIWSWDHSRMDLQLLWTPEIDARGVRSGLRNYSGEPLNELYTQLTRLQEVFGGKKTVTEISKAHLEYLKDQFKEDPSGKKTVATRFVESLWADFVEDLQKVGDAEKRAPALYWLEKVVLRIREASPPVDGLKPETGLRIYRLQQAPVFRAKRLWILGMPSRWLSGEGLANSWYSEREREILALEFEVRSKQQVHHERLEALLGWVRNSEECTVLDSHYDVDGKEPETLLPVLEELGFGLNQSFGSEGRVLGAHPFLNFSYVSTLKAPAQELTLPPMPSQPGGRGPQITATALDRYSRCSFQALAYHRWDLRDLRDPEPDLWPDVRGNLLHSAVRTLLRSRTPAGDFSMTCEMALELAWRARPPKGLIQSRRIHKYIKSRLVLILEAFCEKEKAYFEKSGAIPVSLDDTKLERVYEQFSILGQPDRIDRFEGGYFLMDYKSSGSLPNGTEMIERGYRLQLPFYGVAFSKTQQGSVCGLQFIELDSGAGRKSGILFKSYNGKEPGNLTELRANSKSLIEAEPEEVWAALDRKIEETATSYILGHFVAMPNVEVRSKECGRCRVQDLCGYRRLGMAGAEEV